MSSDKPIEIENTGRDVLVFPVLDNPKAKRPVEVKRLVIGDSADREPWQGGPRDPKLQPDPTVQLTKEEWDELGPHNHRVLNHYIGNGTLRVIRGRELIGA